MSLARIQRYYGLKAPFDLKIAVPFLLAILGAAAVALLALGFALGGGLIVGTDRFYFFLYLFCFCLLAALLGRFTVLALCLVFWCATDLGVALTSNVLAAYGIGENLLPGNQFSFDFYHQFTYHPLLQAVPKRNWREATRLGILNGQYFEDYWSHRNPTNDRELVFYQNSLGARGPELTRDELRRDLVFVYGGSTTYDLGVTQGKTWVEQLQRLLDNRVTLLNFGVPGYSTSEHVIQTAFYESAAGKRPVCAVYYIGWNDIRNAHIDPVDGAYANFHLLSQLDNLQVRKKAPWIATYSPILLVLFTKIGQWFDTVPDAPARALFGKAPVSGNDAQLEKVFVDHVTTITSINIARGIKTLYVGQLLNREKLTSDQRYGWLPLVKDRDVWSLQERFNRLLESTSTSIGAIYIGVDVEAFVGEDFVDNGHFSEVGAAKFARLIYPTVDANCR